ncbi:deoxynucleoside triphosphate triphosphohydrolase SAMHD1-like isoform X2 [Physella acuta]|uniref:deoxynucleoside triphosphate triphosphohydrolase SAMHD1-like isoform X2 n=1 Tax=Physella acuta TaxID=109671 RepID=UPI0027DAF507|nr:deoxynucleoside triphosphate triphosphohydrolase SAMHD1-like isoform X2 [Physella acuta]
MQTNELTDQKLESQAKTSTMDKMTNQTLLTYLDENKVPEAVITVVREEALEGRHLKNLTIDLLMSKDIPFADCLQLVQLYEKNLKSGASSLRKKVYNDPIHGQIEVNPVCQRIIDTPMFQRLRFIKQLGMVYYVFPGAAHNRFEHSLGVYHLAGQFVRTLRQNQPELNITDTDVLCVEIAALCHDLGHGPFSHFFDNKFLREIDPSNKNKHDMAAAKMIDKLKEIGILNLDKDDITFIKEMIGPLEITGCQAWPYVGRGEEKAFLYEIVCNKRNGIDANIWDYLARDCHHLGFYNNFDYSRFMKFARVIEEDGELQICIRDKEIINLYNMFYTRYTLHKFAYQHKVNCGIEMMVKEALVLANDSVFIKANGTAYKISECITDTDAYIELNDNILFKILYQKEDDNDNLKKAKEIINRIFGRDLYTCVWESKPIQPDLWKIFKENMSELSKKGIRLEENMCQQFEIYGVKIEDLRIQILSLEFGMKEVNPVEKLKVYSKKTSNKAEFLYKRDSSIVLGPEKFNENQVRVYSVSNEDSKKENIKLTSEKWFQSMIKPVNPTVNKEKHDGKKLDLQLGWVFGYVWLDVCFVLFVLFCLCSMFY